MQAAPPFVQELQAAPSLSPLSRSRVCRQVPARHHAPGLTGGPRQDPPQALEHTGLLQHRTAASQQPAPPTPWHRDLTRPADLGFLHWGVASPPHLCCSKHATPDGASGHTPLFHMARRFPGDPLGPRAADPSPQSRHRGRP
ncbi:hypothetical protein NDU88_001280 [Pleurodeles waltl]|uniref:Uncharacterized protein n=1 Tax=Pleurodeles waltl TaxID=8319 RepID=A0AAV7LX75_PLEWA|nr:hypothetical protein NDU88_001280 [Pleurodeles waltl]